MTEDIWQGEFGKEYTDRNRVDFDELYARNYGISRTELNTEFLGNLSVDRILEVGCNTGGQLDLLRDMEYGGLYGMDVQAYVVERSLPYLNIIQGQATDIPFKDNWFDLVFTSGLLIHIPPLKLIGAMQEIYRCSKRYIWGFEYFSEEYTEIEYRGHDNLLWKGDFVKIYLDLFPDLKLVKERKLQYLDNNNVDTMFLLEKI